MFKYFNLITLAVSNFQIFKFFKISEDGASQLIKRRKDEYGNIDRETYVLINFRVTCSLDQSINKLERNEHDYNRQLVGEITSIELYKSERLNENDLIGVIE
jgi:hypothetical protein